MWTLSNRLRTATLNFELLLILLIAFTGATAARAGVGTNGVVTLCWDYPEEVCTNLSFRLYTSTDPAVPLAQWSVLTNVPGTTRELTLEIGVAARFFYLTAVNWWGGSDPSNVASVPTPPRSGTLWIRRGSKAG